MILAILTYKHKSRALICGNVNFRNTILFCPNILSCELVNYSFLFPAYFNLWHIFYNISS